MKSKKLSISAVIVTHNRKDWLIECINAIEKQTLKVHSILVVNNASDDGTKEWLDQQSNLEIIHQDNVGGAGGFESGIKRAHEQGSDWIWCLDDDVVPFPDALETMLDYSEISKCINTNKVDIEGNLIELGGFMGLLPSLDVTPTQDSRDALLKWDEFRGACFEGMLIHREVVDLIGYPLGAMFIAGDDTLYGLLASLHTKVILLKEPVICKKKSINVKNKLFFENVTVHSDFYLYHVVRNSFVVKNLLVALFNRSHYDIFKKILTYCIKCILRSVFIRDIPMSQISTVFKALVDGAKLSKKYNQEFFRKNYDYT